MTLTKSVLLVAATFGVGYVPYVGEMLGLQPRLIQFHKFCVGLGMESISMYRLCIS